MAAYADFIFYTDTYGGTAIASADFSTLAIRASHQIDFLTFDRAAEVISDDDDVDLVEAVQLATCAVAEVLYEIQNGAQTGIKSESVGSHAVTFVDGAKAALSEDARCALAAKRYLGRTGLMYLGFNSGEYGGMPAEV